jgi:hypothetical protein
LNYQEEPISFKSGINAILTEAKHRNNLRVICCLGNRNITPANSCFYNNFVGNRVLGLCKFGLRNPRG